MPVQRTNVSIWFRLAAVAGGVFVVTIFSLLMSTMFSDPRSPAVQFLNRHGGRLIAWEVAAILLLGLVAMSVDRRESKRRSLSAADSHSNESNSSTDD